MVSFKKSTYCSIDIRLKILTLLKNISPSFLSGYDICLTTQCVGASFKKTPVSSKVYHVKTPSLHLFGLGMVEI